MSEFTVHIKKRIPMDSLITSTSIALGEAYMDGTLDMFDAFLCIWYTIFMKK